MSGLLPKLDRVIGLSGGALDGLMPMHLWIDASGRILRAGPTLTKMVGQGDLTGNGFFSVIELRGPARADTVAGLGALAGQRIGLALVSAPHLPLRGALAVLPGGAGMILDVSLGLSFAKAVAGFGLTLSDFSPCDQTVELLYLHEANAATMALSRHLTRRLEAARADAEMMALTDPLTGLANRRAMDGALARALADSGRDFGVLQIDLDLFKQVNDTHGHAAGDAVLEHVGHVLRHQLRLGDVAARVGGDEFTVLIRDAGASDDLGRIAARLIRGLERPVIHRGQSCFISASIGIAAISSYVERPTIQRLLSDADGALYAAKRAGRGRYAVHGGPPIAIAPPFAPMQRRRQNDRVPRPD